MQAEIITIGTELLLGQIIDTNAAYLAKKLAAMGFNVFRSTTIGDNQDRIANAVRGVFPGKGEQELSTVGCLFYETGC